MPRRRQLTEMIGTHLSKSDYDVMKAELKRRRLTVADYLREAVKPLLAAPAEVQDGGLRVTADD